MTIPPPPARPGPKAHIDWRDGTPYASAFGDLYFSADDPQGEVRHTFLAGTCFEELCRHQHITVAETGFGTGLNFLEAWAIWDQASPPDARMDYLSVEAFPMALDDLARAHDRFPDHAGRASELRTLWPGAVHGLHRLSLADGRIRLILMIGDAGAMLSRQAFQADAWFLDGFAPAKNPDMWHPDVLSQIARLSRPGARLATFTAAGEVRRGLHRVGFTVRKRDGFGRKRHCLGAVLTTPPDPIPNPEPWTRLPAPHPISDRILVIGDGIAGRALTRSLHQAGRDPIRIGGGASRSYAASALPDTLPRALIAPKLIRGDQPFTVFWRQAYPDALRCLDGLEADVWRGPRGLVISAEDPETEARQRLLLEDLAWPETLLRKVDGAEASALAGRTLPGGLYLPKSGSIDPHSLIQALAPDPEITGDVAALIRQGDCWKAVDASGHVLAEAECVILACGPGCLPLLPDPPDGFGLRIGSGQIFRAQGAGMAGCAILGDGYVTAQESDGIFTAGSTFEGWQSLAPVPVDPQKTDALRQRLAPLLPPLDAATIQPWTGLRCDTTDHLPLCGPVKDPQAFATAYAGLRHGKPPETMPDPPHLPGLYTLTGLGARGFQAAFLLADHLTAQITGTASPLPHAVANALLPSRFQIRNLRRGG